MLVSFVSEMLDRREDEAANGAHGVANAA